MICDNITVGTRHDLCCQSEISGLCNSMKRELSSQIAIRLNSTEINGLMRMQFKVPQPRIIKSQHLLTASSTRQDKDNVSEMMLKVKEDCVINQELLESKKSLKIVKLLVEFEDQAFAQKLVDSEKLTRLRKISRVLLSDALKIEDVFKFAHLETIMISITMTAGALLGLSFKKVFGILENIFGKKIKLSKLKKTKGYELMKCIGFRVWDVY